MTNTTVFSSKLSNSWAEFVNCPRRLRTLGKFLLNWIPNKPNCLILDGALGIGCETIYLKKLGYNVISNEIDLTLIEHAKNAAKSQNVELDVFTYDWREIDEGFSKEIFDVIFLLGNSLCLLETKEDILESLINFYKILKPGGTFIVDERNFPYILKNKTEILNGNFRYSGNYMYCGDTIKGIPTVINSSEVIFSYFNKDNLLGTLKMLPFQKEELPSLLNKSGFQTVAQFSDFNHGYNEFADFFIYVVKK
jgi:SAM-dependent methyltransferase